MQLTPVLIIFLNSPYRKQDVIYLFSEFEFYVSFKAIGQLRLCSFYLIKHQLYCSSYLWLMLCCWKHRYGQSCISKISENLTRSVAT